MHGGPQAGLWILKYFTVYLALLFHEAARRSDSQAAACNTTAHTIKNCNVLVDVDFYLIYLGLINIQCVVALVREYNNPITFA